jgi:3-oxoacyl-[acyl-carrier-protein] synthase II
MRRVVVTGLGTVCPVGNDLKSAWQALIDGKCGVGPIKSFDASNLPVQIAAEIKDFSADELVDAKELPRISRFCHISLAAAKEAVTQSGIDYKNSDTRRWGVSIGVGLGALDDIEESALALHQQSHKRVSPFFIPYAIPNMAAGIVSRDYNLKGPNLCTTTACASGSHGIGEAWLYIRSGMADVMVCGGSEAAISPLGIVSFANMKALCKGGDDPTKASRPFDANRSGFVMAEGTGIVVLEDYEHAKKRGATILAELVGYGASADAFHITAPAPEGEGGARCMQSALVSAGLNADQVDYINAHGTSTKLNDMYETAAIKTVFQAHAQKVAISSIKGATGHCLGGAGGIEAVITVKAMQEGVIPPTINYETPDPDCDLDYTPNTAKEKKLGVCMSNSFGFGGTNAALVFATLR